MTETILRKVWAIRLERSGFHDLENADKPDAPLSNAGQPGRQDGRLSCRYYTGVVDDRRGGSTGENLPPLPAATVALRASEAIGHWAAAEYYRRLEHLAARFENELDQRIAEAMSNGLSERAIKAKMRVGQYRVVRIAKQLRIWMREKETEDDE